MRDVANKMTYYARCTDGTLLHGYQHAAGSATWHGVLFTDYDVAGNPAVAFDAEGKQV